MARLLFDPPKHSQSISYWLLYFFYTSSSYLFILNTKLSICLSLRRPCTSPYPSSLLSIWQKTTTHKSHNMFILHSILAHILPFLLAIVFFKYIQFLFFFSFLRPSKPGLTNCQFAPFGKLFRTTVVSMATNSYN